MNFNMTKSVPGEGSSKFITYIKYDARAGRWFTKPDGGDDEFEVKQVVALMDLEQIKSGWMHFAAGMAPSVVLDPGPGVLADRPSPDHKRGFRLMMYAPKNFGGVREWTANSKAAINGVVDLIALYTEGRDANPGKVPLVECVDTRAVAGGQSTNYEPVFAIKSWHARPAEMPLEAAPAAAPPAKPAGAQHAPPPRPAQQEPAAVAGAEF